MKNGHNNSQDLFISQPPEMAVRGNRTERDTLFFFRTHRCRKGIELAASGPSCEEAWLISHLFEMCSGLSNIATGYPSLSDFVLLSSPLFWLAVRRRSSEFDL